MKRIKFTDITLREAARGLEGALSFKEIIEMAKILDRLNLDVISLAPITSVKIDSLLVRTIAAAVKKSSLSIPWATRRRGWRRHGTPSRRRLSRASMWRRRFRRCRWNSSVIKSLRESSR